MCVRSCQTVFFEEVIHVPYVFVPVSARPIHGNVYLFPFAVALASIANIRRALHGKDLIARSTPLHKFARVSAGESSTSAVCVCKLAGAQSRNPFMLARMSFIPARVSKSNLSAVTKAFFLAPGCPSLAPSSSVRMVAHGAFIVVGHCEALATSRRCVKKRFSEMAKVLRLPSWLKIGKHFCVAPDQMWLWCWWGPVWISVSRQRVDVPCDCAVAIPFF